MADYLPHTDEEIAEMLSFLGLSSIEEVFSAVPAALRLTEGLALDFGVPEPDVMAKMQELSRANHASVDQLVCFAGAGAYDHEVPPVVRSLAGRSEFVTSYTPYQAEVSQGVLQAIFEFQTMVSRLAGLPIANGSLYDGASSLVEGVNLGVAASGNAVVWVSSGVHPHWRGTLRTFAAGTGHKIVEAPLVGGVTKWDRIESSPTPGGLPESPEAPGVIVVGYPNYLGCLEDLAAVRQLCDQHGAVMVVAADPVSAGILRSPGEWGADVVIGEGQAFGVPLGFGGPYLGLFACSLENLRRLPGRLVGETVDLEGSRAYVMTLRTREQDIRRERASSNVCTNQTLMAITAAIQLGWLGTSGLAEVALRCARGTRYCRDSLLGLDGVSSLTDAPVVREFAVRTPIPAHLVVERMADEGYLAGVAIDQLFGGRDDGSLSRVDSEHGLLVAVTERRTREEVDGYVAALEKVVRR